MTLVWWIALGLVAWTIVPMPLALLIGRAVRGDDEVDRAYAMRRARHLAHVDA